MKPKAKSTSTIVKYLKQAQKDRYEVFDQWLESDNSELSVGLKTRYDFLCGSVRSFEECIYANSYFDKSEE